MTPRELSGKSTRDEHLRQILEKALDLIKKDAAPSFPQSLMGLLSTGTHDDIISWLPNGQSFIIRNREGLSGELLRRYFNLSSSNAFINKLHQWGFTFAANTDNATSCNVFFHKLFKRGNQQLCMQMRPHFVGQSMDSSGRRLMSRNGSVYSTLGKPGLIPLTPERRRWHLTTPPQGASPPRINPSDQGQGNDIETVARIRRILDKTLDALNEDSSTSPPK